MNVVPYSINQRDRSLHPEFDIDNIKRWVNLCATYLGRFETSDWSKIAICYARVHCRCTETSALIARAEPDSKEQHISVLKVHPLGIYGG